jgi:hypothetical protein
MSRVTEIRYVGYGVDNFDAERAFTPMTGACRSGRHRRHGVVQGAGP